MEYPIKVKILQFIIKKLDNASDADVKFSLKEIGDVTGEYRPSISRELRELREMKLCTVVCTNSRLGLYKLSVYHNDIQAMRSRLQKRIDTLISKKKSNVFQIKRLLNDAAAGISRMPSDSKTVQS
jgi:DNA-binding transcriptional regulator GbsR (MarR family)